MFSFSKIELFKQCPRKYKFRYIEKIPVNVKMPHLIKGSNVHKVLETHNTEKFLETYSSMGEEVKTIINKFVNSDLGIDILSPKSVREAEIFFNSDIKPCLKEDAIFVGYIDRINLRGDTVELIDFKTGKYKDLKYQSFDQLITYALYIHNKTNINSIKLRYVYVEHLKENVLDFEKKSVELHTELLKKSMNDIENTTKEDSFTKNMTKLCDWCEYKELCLENKYS